MVSKRGTSSFACSPDAVACINISHLGLPSSKDLQFASMKIKTSVVATSYDRALHNTSEDVFSVKVGDEKFVSTVAHEHSGQILQHALVLAVDYIVYVSASEINIFFICVIAVPLPIREASFSMLYTKLHSVADCAHQSHLKVLHGEESSSQRLVAEKIQFWKLLIDHVSEQGPFPTLKLFKHGSQSFYSTNNGDVDGAAQYRSTLRSSMVALR